MLATIFVGSRTMIAKATVNDTNPIIYYTPKATDIVVTKYIVHRNASATLVSNYETYLEESVTVRVEITNNGPVPITNVSLINRESNLTNLGYKNEWFTINDPNNNWTLINPGNSVFHNYNFIPHRTGSYNFRFANVTYTNGTEYYWSKSNDITFKVYEYGLTVTVDKSIIFEGEEYFEDPRVKIDKNFVIKINITNYEFQKINITLWETDPGNTSIFGYNTTLLATSYDYSNIQMGQSIIFQYEVNASVIGMYNIPACNITYLKIYDNLWVLDQFSNELELEVYKPIYEGNDWTKKVPMLSVIKYFQIEVDGILSNETELFYYNTTKETVTIIINITNSGIVNATNIRIDEPTYQNWVFDTEGIQDWTIDILSKGESRYFNYTIFPKINGAFKIEPTVVTYDYQNQETLLIEENYKLYSNVIEIIIDPFIEEPDYTKQWWITIGISFAVVFAAIIPTVITFVLYRKRKRTQKGA